MARDRQAVSSNELPGFPPDARVLIVNADDCGMYAAVNAAVNAAVIDSIDHWHSEFAQPDGAVSGRREAMQLFRLRRDIPVGISPHSRLTRSATDGVP